MTLPHVRSRHSLWWFAAAMLLCLIVYWPGLYGSWFFDDYPNIVDNTEVQPAQLSVESTVRAALSSPASEFKRPLASLSFMANFLANGLDTFGWKLTNLLIHLFNGWLVFVLTRRLLALARPSWQRPETRDKVAALVAGGWLLLPINLTAVLYLVQRMESLANLFVLAGLIGYLSGRSRLLAGQTRLGLLQCAVSVTLPAALGLLAKESAISLPLYALLVELIVFGLRPAPPDTGSASVTAVARPQTGLIALFAVVLLLPLAAGLTWLLPWVLNPATWAARDFTLATRLLTECRIVMDYIAWTVLPTPQALSFYHDDFPISQGLLQPMSTALATAGILMALSTAWLLRHRAPLVSLGITLFFAGHLLTGTILPLELVYEHRNYFPSFGLLLAVVPALFPLTSTSLYASTRKLLLGVLFVWWSALTGQTAIAWGDSLSLARELAIRAPNSARAQFDLGRSLLGRANFDPAAPTSPQAFAALERAAGLPRASVLPEQTLIVTHSVANLPLPPAWWDSMIAKLREKMPDVQDIGAIGALERCMRAGHCKLPTERMDQVFDAALAHPKRSGDLLVIHADYAWNIQHDPELAERSAAEAVAVAPREPSYRVTLLRIQIARGRHAEAQNGLQELRQLNAGGGLDREITELNQLLEQGR